MVLGVPTMSYNVRLGRLVSMSRWGGTGSVVVGGVVTVVHVRPRLLPVLLAMRRVGVR